MSNIRPEFEHHELNEKGKSEAKAVAEIFSWALDKLMALGVVGAPGNTRSREGSLVITKMQEAAFFAKRHVALDPNNQA